jgi:hypothetical protein
MDFFEANEFFTNHTVNQLGEPCTLSLGGVEYDEVRCVITHVNSGEVTDGKTKKLNTAAEFRFVKPDDSTDPVLGDTIIWRNKTYTIIKVDTGKGNQVKASATNTSIQGVGNAIDKGRR